MKKVTLATTMLLAAIALGACSSKTNESSSTSSQMASSSKEASVALSSVNDLQSALENQGLKIIEVVDKEHAIIQAIDGKGYVLDDGSSVEIYEYKTDSEMFESVKADGELLGMKATIIENFVIITVNETSHQEEIDAALDTYK